MPRLFLAGSLTEPAPLILSFTQDDIFDTAKYIDLGFNRFDVVCIGGGGGRGGGVDTENTGTQIRNYGGAGGGGGIHRVQGLLSVLPDSCPIHVGLAGDVGEDVVSDVNYTTDGGDGGYSSFNDTTCLASGGKGGSRAQSNASTIATTANGGQGGIGGTLIAGGGAQGGTAGTPTATGPGTAGTAGKDGTWNSVIGTGGGGGAGGVGLYSSKITCNAGTAGGRGAYNAGDVSMFASGGNPLQDPNGIANIMPGSGGGAKAAPLNGLNTVFYGSSDTSGIVIIRLTPP